MGFHVFWPAATCLTLFIVGVIIILLRFGPRLCKVRHTPLSDEDRGNLPHNAYQHRDSYA